VESIHVREVTLSGISNLGTVLLKCHIIRISRLLFVGLLEFCCSRVQCSTVQYSTLL